MALYQADIAVRDSLGDGGPGADYRAGGLVPDLSYGGGVVLD